MRTTFLAALLGSTALAAAALAQTQPQVTPTQVPEGQAQAKAAIAECDRLLAFLDPNRPSAGITVERAREWKADSDAAACRAALDRLTQASAGAAAGQAQATAPQAAPNLPPAAPAREPAAGGAAPSAQAAPPAGPAPAGSALLASPAPGPAGAAGAGENPPAPRVVVQQQQPSVTVRQARPDIIVRIPPPVITVQQPQPEIIVRMPEPDVNVAVARPEVQVTLPQPQVQVHPPGPQANVQVERQEPNVRIERTGEPRIVYQPADGQPQIRFEPMGAGSAATPARAMDQQRAQAQLNDPQTGYGTHTPPAAAQGPDRTEAPAAAQTTGALPAADRRPIAAARLADMTLYNAREEKLGDVEAVVAGPGGRTALVVSHGGFLGLGERRVAVPVDQVALRGDRLVADGLSDEELRALPDYARGAGSREMQGDQSTEIRVLH